MDRVSPGDLTQLATDVGPAAMNVGAALLLDTAGSDLARVRAALVERIAGIPRFRQRLVDVPFGLGRPVWVDAPDFDAAAHVTELACPAPGDTAALLEVATDAVTEPLPRDRPLWRAVLVDLADGHAGLVLVLHHVIADGIGGLAVLAALADGTTPPGGPASPPAPGGPASPPTPASLPGPGDLASAPAPASPRPMPSSRDLALDRASAMRGWIRSAPAALGRLRDARAELGHAPAAPRCSLNTPTGARRHVDTVEVELAAIRAAAARNAATINDILLVATTAALQTALAERGEHPPALVVSVPISARGAASARQLGNQVGVMPVRVPLDGPLTERLARVAGTTAAQRGRVRGASAALVGPAFRALAAVGVFRWFVDRQRLVNTFLTNLRGPSAKLRFGGAVIERITPVSTTAGNVTTAFAALSYAGTLTISIVTDPERVPEHDRIREALHRHLTELSATPVVS